MPLGIVSNEDFASEVNNSSVPMVPATNIPVVPLTPDVMSPSDNPEIITDSSVLIKKYHPHGRNLDDVNVPQSLRKLIGDAAISEGRPAALELASSLGISNSSVSSYTNPANSALSDSNKQDILNVLTDKKTKISRRALNKLNLAMSFIDENNLKDLKALDLSNVAKNMAQVAKHMEPPTKDEAPKSPVQFLMYAPQVKQENHYQTVVAKDNY